MYVHLLVSLLFTNMQINTYLSAFNYCMPLSPLIVSNLHTIQIYVNPVHIFIDEV